MSKRKIFSIYIAVDLMLVAGALWCFFHRIPAREFLVPLIVLFCLNGLWLIWITVRNTPHGNREG
jgi:hypothetical protein